MVVYDICPLSSLLLRYLKRWERLSLLEKRSELKKVLSMFRGRLVKMSPERLRPGRISRNHRFLVNPVVSRKSAFDVVQRRTRVGRYESVRAGKVIEYCNPTIETSNGEVHCLENVGVLGQILFKQMFLTL